MTKKCLCNCASTAIGNPFVSNSKFEKLPNFQSEALFFCCAATAVCFLRMSY